MENYHLTNQEGEWKLKKENSQRTIKKFENKKEAVQQSVAHVKKVSGSLKIHKVDGTIQEERTFPKSKDPKKTKG